MLSSRPKAGPKGRNLEVGARRALLVLIILYQQHCQRQHKFSSHFSLIKDMNCALLSRMAQSLHSDIVRRRKGGDAENGSVQETTGAEGSRFLHRPPSPASASAR